MWSISNEFCPVNADNLKLSCKTEPDNCYSPIKGWIPHQNVNINIIPSSADSYHSGIELILMNNVISNTTIANTQT